MPEQAANGIICSRFAVGETPYCVWEWDLVERNLEFIEGLKPEFFAYLAEVHNKELTGEQRQLAALALRALYSQGLETLFALLMAAVQAPDCIVGWLPKYTLTQLRDLVKKISTAQPIFSKLSLNACSWQELSMAKIGRASCRERVYVLV